MSKLIPPTLEEGYRTNFNTLCRAFEEDSICLVSSIRKSDGAPVALVCALNYNEDNTVSPVPFAVMCEGNPYEDFVDPFVEA